MCDELISPSSVHQFDGQRVPTQYSLSYSFTRCCNIIGIYDSKQNLISSAAHSTALQQSELVALFVASDVDGAMLPTRSRSWRERRSVHLLRICEGSSA